MNVLRVVTSILISIMIIIVYSSILGMLGDARNRTTVIGFTFMEIVYVLSIVCIWY